VRLRINLELIMSYRSLEAILNSICLNYFFIDYVGISLSYFLKLHEPSEIWEIILCIQASGALAKRQEREKE